MDTIPHPWIGGATQKVEQKIEAIPTQWIPESEGVTKLVQMGILKKGK